jgi:uncharacterized protein (TIGR03086 family)
MKERDLFLQSDAALRDVFDRVDPDLLTLPVPADWTQKTDPTLRDIVADHAYDEAWVPDVLAGKTVDEVGDAWSGDLLGDDPFAAYDALNDAATVAANQLLDPDDTVHLSYGDFPVSEYFVHVSTYRAFQAWSIAKLVELDYSLPDDLVEALWETVGPRIDEFRQMGIFGPEVAVPQDADRETQLLGATGFWRA